MKPSFPSFRLFAAFLLIFCSHNAQAQNNFTLLDEGDYEIQQKRIIYPSNFIMKGYYESTYLTNQKGFNGAALSNPAFYQDARLRLKSVLKPNVSINFLIAPYNAQVSEQPSGYREADRAYDQGTRSSGLTLEFSEAYINYYINPETSWKIGRQEISLGDDKGMIYQGYATANTLTSRIGTWPFDIGGAKLDSDHTSETLFWAELFYPVYESGQTRKDPSEKKGERDTNSLSVEIFRVIYQSSYTPLSYSGSMTGSGSTNHLSDGTNKYYYNSLGVNYNGFNLIWNYFDHQLKGNYIILTGTREYFKDSYQRQGTYDVSGQAYEFSYRYFLTPDWIFEATSAKASGTEYDGTALYAQNTSTYYAVQNGYYGDALIYFDGKQHTGQGHAFSNLAYSKLTFAYYDSTGDYEILMDGYKLQRVTPVSTATGLESSIGSELDFTIRFNLEEGFSTDLLFAGFKPGPAYSTADYITPDESNNVDLFRMGANVRYSF